MNSTSTHFVPARRVNIYEPLHQFGMWGETFKSNIGNGNLNTPSHIIIQNSQLDNNLSEDTSHGTPLVFDQETSTSRHPDKIKRRLAQNREAAKKSRLRKKAYVQQLETSRLKLIQLEQELDRARQQGFYVGNGIDTSTTTSLGFSENMNPGVYQEQGSILDKNQNLNVKIKTGIVAFEMEYGHWIEEQNKQICELRTVLQGHVGDVELRLLVEIAMKHYFDLFRMKSAAAKEDVFFIMSGMWRTSAERFFLWIGGFRPSDLIKVLLPHFDVMTDQQILDVCNLRQSCQQAEDALSQGMEKLQHTLADCIAGGRLGEGNYVPQVNSAMERAEASVSFVNQADHLRHETLQQMHRILTTRQAARGLLALGEYFQRLRALSSSWATRHREPA
ncbi:transcription factor TGA1 isoform X1 [Raphanus sativus]|uniref:Transcription factor TGA1 isoform X1 n=1 Tax=Raphanus sativus TaxID=3726 RepID=A0A6J0KYE9_RAPSA|nr:transcription factor TGA1 isoform X1 [Raphanus sativus]XP_018452634.1 transcription factor TGA1 isoform X1 [Raphanus sativus]